MSTRILAVIVMLVAALVVGCRDSSRTSSGEQPNGVDTARTATTTTPDSASQGASPSSTPGTPPAPAADSAPKAIPSGHAGISGETRQAPMTRGLPEEERPLDFSLLPGATITIEDMSERVVATTTSDANGKFYIELPSAWYLLIAEPFVNRTYPHPPVSQQVFVPRNGTAQVTFTYDSGIK